MAKFGITKSNGIKIVGFLDIRQDENLIYVEIDGRTFDLLQLISDYDGEVISISCSKQSLPDCLVDDECDDECIEE